PTKDPDVYATVGARLMRADDSAAASRAYLKALELDPLEEDIIDELKKIDPNGALAALDRSIEEMGGEALPMIDLQRAELLSELGRKDEAIALVQGMVGYDPKDPWAISLLAELDPEGVERSLRRRLESDPTGAVAVNLAERLADQDREDEAAQLLEDTLARSPENSNALNQLAYIEPDKALSYLDSPAADRLSASALSYAAEALVERGQTADAVELWIRAMDSELDDHDVVEGLKKHAPERLWDKYRQIANQSKNDEELGDVADVYWESGRKEEAAELWRRASLIDPDDSEWSNKLRSVLLGQNPM
ncbi:MAG: tetratricopeptide repeat protein, partial [Planctomycetota bacterium]